MTSIKVRYGPRGKRSREGCIYYELQRKRQERRIVTAYCLYEQEWDSEHSVLQVSNAEYHRRDYLQSIEKRILRDIAHLQRMMDELINLDEIVQSYWDRVQQSSVQEFSKRVVYHLIQEGRLKTACSYQSALRVFMVYVRRDDLNFDDMNSVLMRGFEQHLRQRHLCNNTISYYMRMLRALYNRAVEALLTDQTYPFRGIYVGIDKTAKRAVTYQTILRLKSEDLSNFDSLALTRDLFLFSFYARGMAFVDVAHLTKDQLKNGYIVYQRHKTKQLLSVRIEPCMQELLDRYATEPMFCFPVLRQGRRYESALRLQNMRLKYLSERLGLETVLTTYVARHSWASVAKQQGVATQVISESMGHNNEKTTLIYLSSLSQMVIDQTNAQLLSDLQV